LKRNLPDIFLGDFEGVKVKIQRCKFDILTIKGDSNGDAPGTGSDIQGG